MAEVLTVTPSGIYCPAGDFYIDPSRAVPRAVITHGHADHARRGHDHYLTSEPAAPAIRHRLGRITLETMRFGEARQIGAAQVSLHPAGHVPGSAQIRVAVGGEVWVVSGDYKTTPDGLSEPFEPVACHTFITECTFGLPLFHWPSEAALSAQINSWWAECLAAGRTPVLGAYSLGKAQRLLTMLDPRIGPILTHPAIEDINRVLRAQGIALPQTRAVTPQMEPQMAAQARSGALVLAPPSVMGSGWIDQFARPEWAFASGWMRLRRRRQGAGAGFVVSDHADWGGLNAAIAETGAERIYATHGYTAQFQRWLAGRGYDARILGAGAPRAHPEGPQVAAQGLAQDSGETIDETPGRPPVEGPDAALR